MSTVLEPTPPEVSERRILQGSLVLAAGLLVSQLTGFIRQAAIGYLLGTGSQADALTAAMAPIEIWWNVLNIAVIYGFVPKFSEQAPGGEARFGDILKPLWRLSAVSSIAFFVFAKPLILLFAPGLDAATVEMGASLLRINSLSATAVGCTFVYNALLMSRRWFVVPSLHQAAVNAVTILSALWLNRQYGVYSFAIGYSAGAWLYVGFTHLYSRNLIATQKAKARKQGLFDLLRGPAPILGQAFAVELNTAVSRGFASTFGSGMTAAFDYGFRVFRVPLALLVVPLSQSLLPEISSLQRSAKERRVAAGTALRATWLAAAAGGAVMICMMLFRNPIVALLFQRGAFGGASTEAVAAVLLGYMPVMVGRVISEFLSRALFGMGRLRVPLAISVIALVVNFLICTVLPSQQPALIGLGAAIGFLVGAAWVVEYVRRLAKDA